MMETVKERVQFLLNLDYFSLFGLPINFQLDVGLLKDRYFELQKQFHPDKFVHNNDAGLCVSVGMLSAKINDAYNTLEFPLCRAVYLLEQYGFPIDLARDTKLSGSFLIQQMDFHDKIQDARDNRDVVALKSLEAELLCSENRVIGLINKAFEISDYLNVKELTKQLAFYERIKSSVDNAY